MPKAKLFLRNDERQALAHLFYRYPTQRMYELMESEVIPTDLMPYLPYLEAELNVAMMKGLEEYDKNNERAKRKRPLYFKAYLDKVSENHITSVVLRMHAAIARVEGKASRTPLKADKELYDVLHAISDGHDMLDLLLAELD